MNQSENHNDNDENNSTTQNTEETSSQSTEEASTQNYNQTQSNEVVQDIPQHLQNVRCSRCLVYKKADDFERRKNGKLMKMCHRCNLVSRIYKAMKETKYRRNNLFYHIKYQF